MKNCNHYFWCLIILFLPLFSFSQVSITYVNPIGNTVCDSATYQVTITNNSPDSIKDVFVTIDFPMGISYVNNSVVDAAEQNITNLNTPVFGLPNMASGAAQTFSFDGFYQCDLIDNINSGALFTNDITVDHQTGSQSTTTSPYLIETALLIITGTTNDNLIGTKGDILTRTITIQNTRIGDLSSFNFIDQHEGGISISADYGTVTNSSPTFFEIQLDSDDFMNIGDGDGLFELNEVITITETILITSCGYDQNDSNSNFSVNWGCDGAICQEAFSFAVIQFLPSQDNPIITGQTSTELPTNFCAETPAKQSLTIQNIGSSPAINIDVIIRQSLVADINGMHPNSFIIDSSGTIEAVNPSFAEPVDFDGCSLNSLVYKEATVVVPFLSPGESVTIEWDNYSCAQGCGSPILGWAYEINYLKSCPENEIVVTTGSNTGDTPIGDIMIDTVTFAIGTVILDNTTHTLDYGLGSDLLDDSTGTLNLEFLIPCGFVWEMDNNLVLGGQEPINFDIQTNSSGSIVNLEYDLPMNSDTVFTSFDLSFTCDAPCLPPAQYIEQYNTSCPPLDLCVGDTIYNDTMSVNTSIILDTTSTAFCAIQECQTFPLQYVCYNGLITQVYPPGYLDYELESLRYNYGLVDNDNDRVADASGNLNLNLVRQDRMIPGDTIRTVIDGSILMDIPDSSFSLGTININFSSHSADDEIDNGFWLDPGDEALMDQDGIIPISAVIRIEDSDGGVFECPIDPAGIQYLQRAKASVPNTRPEEVIDEVIFTSYAYNISIAALQSCLPPGYVYKENDVIEFITLHKMVYNPLKDLGPYPMIVNMRTGSTVLLSNPGEQTFACICPTVNWQYSPYRYRISPGRYNILPCETFDSPGGQRFEMFLGEGNFFPFEVRPLAYINEWNMTIPPQVNLLESTLTTWELQQGPTLATNVPLTPDGQYSDDFEPYQTPLIDEGFFFSLDHEFDSDCFQEIPLRMDHFIQIDFADNLPEITDPLDTLLLVNGSFNPLRPFLSLETAQSNFVSFDNEAIWNFSLTNYPSGYPNPAEHVWMTITSPTGLLTDFQLINLTTGQIINPSNGIFQLGTYNINQSDNFQLIATTNSCNLEQLIVEYGWDCEPYISTSDTPCDVESFIFSVISPRGEIEMNVMSPVTPVDLCDTIPYHTIEIFNAQVGAVFNVNLEATLPQGLVVIPGSCQLAYPSSGTYVDIADPIDLGNGNVQWDISALSDSITSHGLSGITSSPENSVSIRFLSGTECGFIAGSQIIFTASATQNCAEATNTISKPGEQIQINGVAPPYESEFFISTGGSTTVGCGDEFTMLVSMQADGVTFSSDSIFITLPPGIFFDEGSYSPLSNAELSGPNISVDSASQVLSWGIVPGIPANNLISFEISLFGFSDANCGENPVLIQSVQEQTAICTATGEVCSVFAQTGSSTLNISIEQPILNITQFGGNYNNGVFTFDLGVNNSSPNNGDGLNVDFYLDLDGDGMLSPGDSLINISNYPGIVNGSGITNINGSFPVGMESLCGLMAVIDENDNCACNSDQSLLLSPLTSTLPPADVCSNTATEIGINGSNTNTYQWTPANNLDCPTCPTTDFTLENTANNTLFLNYTLIEDLGACTINHELTISLFAEPGIIDDTPSMCPEGEVVLNAVPGINYNWQGEGIIDPSLASQTVSPTATSTYSLTITDINNCVGIDEILVEVYPSPDANAGTDELYCVEDIAELNATFNNNYNYEWSPSNQLNNANIPNPTITLNENTTYNLTVTDQNDCTATDEVSISFDEGPDLTLLSSNEQIICDGETVTLEVSGGVTYEWLPANSLNCSTCPIVEANPTETTVYTIFGYNENGCESQTSITVNVNNEPLMGEEIQYLCPGDTIIVFEEIVFEETTLCETFVASNGCDSLHCIQVINADFPVFSFPLDITVEAGMEVTLDLDPNYSYDWEPPGIIPECENCSEVSFELLETTTFSVTVTNEEGCSSGQDSIQVRVFPMCAAANIQFPNAFTPNNDNISDKFGAAIPQEHLELIKKMTIYNRWGNIVFEASGNRACWDGTYKDKPQPSDVYIYVIIVGCTEREDEIITGDLTLIR